MASDRSVAPRDLAARLTVSRKALGQLWFRTNSGARRLNETELAIVQDMADAAAQLTALYDELHATALALRQAELDADDAALDHQADLARLDDFDDPRDDVAGRGWDDD